ncbi:MAG TPA: type 4a pilus biogenesis protein PilO [Methylomirabilota bacterium]|nr:type 4a pilus biogenesis protein PilO [Methylomirabilota bacterium]
MSKVPKEKRDKIILVGIVTVAVSAALWLLLINSQRHTLRNVRAEAVKSRDQSSRGYATLKTREDVKQQFEEATRRLQTRETAMAAPNDMYSWLIQTLNNFRSNYRVDIPQFGREVPAEVGIFAKFPYRAALFNVRGTANYHDFGRFLADFENAFPYIRVQNIELKPASESQGDGREKLNFSLELLTLVRPIAP